MKIHFFFLTLLMLASCTPGGAGSVDQAFGPKALDPFGENGNAAVVLSPLTSEFGIMRMMTTSMSKTITVRNNARAEIYIQSIGEDSNTSYEIISSNCPRAPLPLDAGSSCTISAIFTPQTLGVIDWPLTIKFGRNATTSEYNALGSLRGTGATDVTFAGIQSIDQIRAASVRANWVDTIGENGYAVFRVTPSSTLEYVQSVPANSTSAIITGLTPGTAYKFRVRAIDFFGQYESNAVNLDVTTTAGISLTSQLDRVMTSTAGEMILGQTYNFDFNNVGSGAPGNDTNMIYTCTYDLIPDGVVNTALPCGSLTGLSLNSGFGTNGQWTWTPVYAQGGHAFEIKMTGSDTSMDSVRIFKVNVRDDYVRTNLLMEVYAPFSTSSRFGMNAPMTTVWDNLKPGGMALNGILSGQFTSGWLGDGTDGSNPYRLKFDGVSGTNASRAAFGTSLNGSAQFAFQSWLRFNNLAGGVKSHVFGAGGEGANGWSVKQTADGLLHFSAGTESDLQATVLYQNPAAYFRFEETSGTTIADSTGHGHTGTLNSSFALNQTGKLGNSATFTGNGYMSVAGLDIDDVTHEYSVSAWIKTPLPNDGNWKTVTRGNTGGGDHQIIFNQSTNEFGSYFGGFYGSGVLANSLSAGWHLFTVVGSGSGTAFYVDGQPKNTTSAYSASDIYAIGNYQSGGQPAYHIDEVSVFLRPLSPTEVSAQFTSRCTVSLAANFWTHYAGIYDGNTLKLMRNGVKVCETNPGVVNVGSTAPFTVGALNDGTQAWPGEIAQLQIFSAINEANVLSSFQSTVRRYLTTPDSIPGLQAWFDASEPVSGAPPADGSALTTWKDKSANGRDMTVLSGIPLYKTAAFGSYPTVYYDGTSSHALNFTVPTSYTIVLVAALQGPNNQRVLGDYTGRNILFGYWGGKMKGYYVDGNPENLVTGPNQAVPATTARTRYIFTRDNTGAFEMFDGRSSYSSSPSSSYNSFKLQVGCGQGTGGECSNVYVSELMVFNKVLNATELDILNNYLETKWGF